MEPEIKHLLEENLQLNKENNAMLHKIRGAQRWAQLYRVAYWVIIIGFSFGAYYFIQPYLESLVSLYSGVSSTANNVSDMTKNLSDVKNFQDLVKSLNQ